MFSTRRARDEERVSLLVTIYDALLSEKRRLTHTATLSAEFFTKRMNLVL